MLRESFDLTPAEVELVLERDAQGFPAWTTAALLKTTIGAVANAIRLHKPPA